MPFTAQELEEMRLADAQIEAEFVITSEEMKEARERDRALKVSRNDSDYQRRYREKNREKLQKLRRNWYLKNRAKAIAKAKARYREHKVEHSETARRYRENNRDLINARQRERRKRLKEEASSGAVQ